MSINFNSGMNKTLLTGNAKTGTLTTQAGGSSGTKIGAGGTLTTQAGGSSGTKIGMANTMEPKTVNTAPTATINNPDKTTRGTYTGGSGDYTYTDTYEIIIEEKQDKTTSQFNKATLQDSVRTMATTNSNFSFTKLNGAVAQTKNRLQ